jgi:hypothetical protein
MVFVTLPFFWSPWSAHWVGNRALAAYEAGKLEDAKVLTVKSMSLGEDRVWASDLLARTYAVSGEDGKYRELLTTIKKMDANVALRLEAEMDQWIKMNRPTDLNPIDKTNAAAHGL